MGRRDDVPSSPAEPLLRRMYVLAMPEAAAIVWGKEALPDLAVRLPDDVRRDTLEQTNAETWMPERYVIAWSFAVWEGPAARDREAFKRFLRAQVDLTFGRVRRALLSLASPEMLLARAGAIWKEDHTHGTLEVEMHEAKNGATLRLHDHPYTTLPQARAAIAEVLRYDVSLTRAKNVIESHRLERDGVLLIRLQWG
jgi:hypothetical protein